MSERGGKEEEGESVTQSRRAGAHREKVEAEMANRVQRRRWSPPERRCKRLARRSGRRTFTDMLRR